MNKNIRDEWIKKQLIKIPASHRLLDAGAGEATYKEFCQHLNYISQDFCEYDGSGNTKGIQTKSWDVSKIDIISDINNIPEKDNSFDVILCTEVFEHLPEPILAIKEFNRLLKAGGKLILTAPFCSLTHFAPYHYYSGFNKYFYEYALPLYNFKILEIETNGNFFDYLIQELYRIKETSETYSNGKRLEEDIFISVVDSLYDISNHDSCSSELLCFGYHVLSEKINNE